jgi:hypothetical protein
VFSVKVDQDKLVASGIFKYKYYEEIDTTSTTNFYVKVLRGRARIKVRACKRWKEYAVTSLSDHVVLKVVWYNTCCGWEECEERRVVMIYEYTRSNGWRKILEHVEEEW